MADNKVYFGLSNVHYCEWDSEANKPKGKPSPIKGGVTLSLDQESESVEFYADNHLYYHESVSSSITGNMQSAYFTDDFLTAHGGYIKLKDGGFAYSRDEAKKPFCLAFQVNGDAKNAIYVLHNVTCGAINRSFETIAKSKEIKPEELPITVAGHPTKGVSMVRYFPENEGYNTIFSTKFPDIADKAEAVDSRGRRG